MDDEGTVILSKRITVRVDTEHKKGCTGQVTVSAERDTADCTSCGTVRIVDASVIEG